MYLVAYLTGVLCGGCVVASWVYIYHEGARD